MDGYWKAYCELNGKTIEETTEFLLELSKGADEYVWYYHPCGKRGKGPHIHGLLHNWQRSDDTFRSRLKAFFNIKGAQLGVSNTYERGKKMSEDTVPTYIGYMSKGMFDPLCYYGISKESLDSRKQIALTMYPPANEEKVENTIVREKVDRKTEYDFQMEAEELLWNAETGHDNVSKDDILDAVVNVLAKHKRLAHYRRVANICQAIMLRIHPVDVQRGRGRRQILKMF